MDKANEGNFFEDFRVGQRLIHATPRTLHEGDAALYVALTGDHRPLHCDRVLAQRLGYQQEPLNDLLVFHTVFGKSVSDISLNAVANLGYAEVLFKAPVYYGDTLRAESEVVGLKENRSGKNGNVYVHTRGLNQRDEVVLQFYRWVMVRKRDESAPAPETTIPTLAEHVSVGDMFVDGSIHFDSDYATATGGRHWFEDYEAGERIVHGSGMTIEESEHATATRLYQNTAKVHFDAHATQGKRLIYGGHIISIASALAFNGLENAHRILAWNGGTHSNPTYASDTLYALTEVLGKEALPGRDDVGALRLRLIAFKNLDPSTEEFSISTHDEAKGRDVYHPSVVLDLDYYVLMPCQPKGS